MGTRYYLIHFSVNLKLVQKIISISKKQNKTKVQACKWLKNTDVYTLKPKSLFKE